MKGHLGKVRWRKIFLYLGKILISLTTLVRILFRNIDAKLTNFVKTLMGNIFFDCLFRGILSHSRILNSYGDVTITSEGLQILTFARQSWSLSSEGSLACHTYCDKGHPFIMVISEEPWLSHLLPSV